jgi:dolichyl-phosphate-mannose-protein mannosyltransferase
MSGLLFQSDGHGTILLHPNPVIWSFALLGAIGLIVLVILVVIWRKDQEVLVLLVWPIGYLASWLPFSLIERDVFVYHYLIALIFGIFSFATFVDIIGDNSVVIKICFIMICVLIVLGSFIYLSPLVYGLPDYDAFSRSWYEKMIDPKHVATNP